MLKNRLHFAGVLAVVALNLGCGGGGSVAFKEGRKAEARKDWDTAVVDYEKALQTDPSNAAYVLHSQQAHTEAAVLHVANGRKLLKDGRLGDAAGEFQKAVSIDPSNKAAAQELSIVLTKQAEAKKAREETIQKALKAREEATETVAVRLKPLPTEAIARFRLDADSRKVFETVGKLAGINIVFTSDFRPTPLSLDLSNIKIEDMLNVVMMQTKTFSRALTPNTLLIIPDSPNNRRDYDEQVLKTIYLSNPMAAADRTAITTALKQVLNILKIVDNPESNAIVIRDSPAQVAAAEQLIHDLDRSRAEILMDVDVVEADRDRIRDLGLSPATITSSGVTEGVQAAAAFAPPSSSGSSSSSTTSAAINTLTYKDYAVVIPGATAQAVLNDSKTHILQSPKVRVTDGQTAKLKIGSRIPYATGSFLPSLGATSSTSGTVGLLASTQFQYQDIGVNLELTPHLLATGEVAVHAKIEISSLGANVSVGGLSQPTFGQRVIEDDFRLQEGEVNLLGGLIQETINTAITGVPGLGDVPLLHYLFSNDHKEVNDQEVLVMLTPRVIRLPEPAVTAGKNLLLGPSGEGAQVGGAPERGPELGPGQPVQPQ